MTEPIVQVRTAYRRRRIVACILLILALLIGVGWWRGRSGIDSRLVGTWRVQQGPASPWPLVYFTMEFRKDGTGSYRGSNHVEPVKWWFDGKRLTWGPDYPKLKSAMNVKLERLRARLLDGDKVAPSDTAVELSDLSPDTLRGIRVLNNDLTRPPLVFQRVKD